jgi:hypothetical protein
VFATNSPVNDKVIIHTKQVPDRTYAIAGAVPKGSWPLSQRRAHGCLMQAHLLPQAAQQLRPRQAISEPREIATSRNQLRAALARIDQEQAAAEACQISQQPDLPVRRR